MSQDSPPRAGTRQAEMTQLLYLALAQPIGLLVASSDREATRRSLYAAKYQAKDEALGDLQIRVSPWPEGELVIVHQTIIRQEGHQT